LDNDIWGKAELLEIFTETLHKINNILKEEKAIETLAEDLWKVIDGKIILIKEID